MPSRFGVSPLALASASSAAVQRTSAAATARMSSKRNHGRARPRVDEPLQKAVETLELLARLRVELGDAGHTGRVRTGVHEDAVADLHGNRPAAQPASVRTARPEGLTVFDATRRIRLEPRFFGTGVGGRCLLRTGAGPGGYQILVLFPGLVAGPCRVVVGKGRADLRGGVTQVAQHVHDFVVADDLLDPALALRRLLIEGHHQVEHAADLGPAVGQVAGLHEGGRAAGPVLSVVDEAGRLEDPDQAREAAVHVADGDDAAFGPRLRDGRRAGDDDGGRSRQQGSDAPHHDLTLLQEDAGSALLLDQLRDRLLHALPAGEDRLLLVL